MDAMILAAGLGTRLGSITQSTPKPLLPIGGVPMLERIARRLVAAGADRLIINTHHLSDQIVGFVRSRENFGVDVAFSHEADRPLETGGAVRHAADLFAGDRPFFLHNADILTDLPLAALYQQHHAASPLATLAVMRRDTARYLLFDDDGLLGRVDETKDLQIRVRRPRGEERKLAFAGVHVLSEDFPKLLTEVGAFSILDPYLRLAGAGYRIEPFRVDGCEWIDIGKPEQLAEANRMLERSLP
jgi:N-acetyl-alpha-D-muramate 1-phosphate uridylyltransferase